MPLELNQELIELSLSILKWVCLGGFSTFLVTYATWLTFLPELSIEGISDKSPKFNSKSRMIITNIGRLPAHNVRADAEKICAEIVGVTYTDIGGYDGPNIIGKLSFNEKSESSVTSGFRVDGNIGFESFSYILTLKYQARFLFIKKSLSRQWKVELSNFEDGYSWNITIL